jgi:hypothetical protein
MPQVIIVRLVPMKPTTGAAFSSYLNNLELRAFDLSFASTAEGTLVGEAKGAWLPAEGPGASGPPFTPANQRIVQHSTAYQVNPLPPPNVFDVRREAVATAIIELNPAPGTEFNTADLRIEIRQGTHLVAYERLDFNVKVEPNAPISNNPLTYIGVDPPAVVLTLPDPGVALDPNAAYVELPPDGTPPKFVPLRDAIDKVLAQDPAGGATLANRSPLSAAEARQVAREIVWNRKIVPPPELPKGRRLEDMYTQPPTDTSISSDEQDKAEMDRKQYEASLAGFYALQSANADRLAQYVFAASAAVWAGQQSANPGRVGLRFPVEPGPPPAPGAAFRQAEVVLANAGGPLLDFRVPDEYFYALSTVLSTNVTAEERYRMATEDNENRLASAIRAAISANTIVVAATSPENAARRLVAIGRGRVQRPALCPFDALVNPVVTAWLAEMGPSIDSFWQQSPFPAALVPGHLELLLCVLTQRADLAPSALISAIKTIPVATVAQLKQQTQQDWHAFFLPGGVGLLPEFTKPGTPAERVEAFVRQLRKYFEVLSIAPALNPAIMDAAAAIPLADGEPLAAFFAAAAGFSFPVANWNAPLVVNALQTVFPGDASAQAWLLQALQVLDELLQATAGVGPVPLQFSLLEALYARGFTSRAQIRALPPAEFERALTGTVAYPHAAAIQAAAGGSTAGPGPAPAGPFSPVNPDGSLINCIPPWHLSPLGPVKYLQDLLLTGEGATCAQPVAVGATLATLLAARRGQLGQLQASAANVHTELPLIDIVNEQLEHLADTGTPGVVYDTAGDELGWHELRPADDPGGEGHLPNKLFAALPEHSSPATPVKKPGAYDKLGEDFTSPALPYSQPLDISRTYLCAMGTSRFATMRTFREAITEFAIDAGQEAADFQQPLWRYPVRIELAIEYLGLSPAEYQTLYVDPISAADLHEMYGFPSSAVDGADWKTLVVHVPEFLKRTGLDYCAFLELWRSEYVEFVRQPPVPPGTTGGRPPRRGPREEADFPDCEPCCPEDLIIRFVNRTPAEAALRRLMVFIRLWHTLKCLPGAGYSFSELRDICEVFEMFQGPNVNPDFIRQLAAFQMLRDDWQLALGTDPDAAQGATGATRTRLLGLWTQAPAASADWALDHLLGRIEDRAEREHAPGRRPGNHRRHRPPEFLKILRDNLEQLSVLGGFDPASTPWHAQPTSTLRFTEILAKIYGSSFTTGDLLYLFSVDQHLNGDDPFFQQDPNEALDQPFDFPEEGHPYDLWSLRRKLLEVQVGQEEIGALTWAGLASAMQRDFGYEPAAVDDPLQELGEHFFPETLAAEGFVVGAQARQYRAALVATIAGMWNFPHPGPFQYDAGTKELVIALPLRDEDVLLKLNAIEQLTPAEKTAVQQLYFAPRAQLARFSFLFASLAAAEQALVEEADEAKRWDFFRHAFLLFARRARVIAQHLAGHAGYATDNTAAEEELAWLLLRHLAGDENKPTTPWEQDNGSPPAQYTWPKPAGGAFAALVRLTGTGLPGEVKGASGSAWPELRGPMTAFSDVRNAWNVPVHTIVPALDFTLPLADLKFALLRNGFAIRESDGLPLAGAEGFTARWSGVLLVEETGTYVFYAGAPAAGCAAPDFEHCGHNRWRVNLRRGQKTFRVLNYRWKDEQAPDHISGPLHLKRGAYFIDIDFEESAPEFDEKGELGPARTGFTVKYQGPDTGECIAELPVTRLYRDVATAELRSGQAGVQEAQEYLALQYTGSLRDIRRTYQRAFKALLFCHRLRLSARLVPRANVSETGYMLSMPDLFAGVSYVAGSPYTSHRADLDFNFLPVGDTYRGDPLRQPPAPLDERATPSDKRRQALFDWFERLYDYTVMRNAIMRQAGRHAWLCFVEASNQQPVDVVPLLMELGIDMDHAPLVLDFHDGVATDWQMLLDDRWAIRVWRAAIWLRRLLKAFVPLELAQAEPDVWAGDTAAQLAAGNANLTQFYRDGMIERGDPLRYADIERLNNLLRTRARAALLAYLTGMDRVALPFAPGTFATSAKDLSALLLLDVEATCQKASRIEEAVTALQSFVERARLSQEPGFVPTPAFTAAWDKRFVNFRVWQACRRRMLYPENYVEWMEHEQALRSEAFRLLESELRRVTFTAPQPGGMEYWPGPYWPAHPGLIRLQQREPSHLKRVVQPENLGLMGMPERHARLSWLAPSQGRITDGRPPRDEDVPGRGTGPVGAAATRDGNANAVQLPLWVEAAVRLGKRFLRIAAAGEPSASAALAVPEPAAVCCAQCGKVHPPVVDEYYFWLEDAQFYDPAILNPGDPTLYQDADWGVAPPDMTSDWHRPERLPQLLAWPKLPMVKLAWCRVHNGEFQTPRITDRGAHVDPLADPAQLEFIGREGDSLRFSITNAAPSKPPGYSDPSPWGFRYDIASDTAVVLPEVIAAPPAPGPFPPSLPAHPFFVYFTPGAPLEPSIFATAMTVAGALRAHCRYEAALKWYELYYAPGDRDLRWATCRTRPRTPSDTRPRAAATTGRRTELDPCCDTVATTELAARQRSVLLAYLETLLQHAQAAMCRYSPENHAIARLRLDTLHKFLGERPRTLFGQDDEEHVQTVAAFVPRLAPLNPRLMQLYDQATDLSDVLQRCETKARLAVSKSHEDTPYWGDDPVREGWKEVSPQCLDDDGCCCPPSPYRFTFLVQRALECAGEVRTFGAALLAAFEKGDAEFMAAMRAGHERQVLNLTEELRRFEFREADWQVQALRKTKEGALARRQYYADLVANGLISKEQAYQNLTGVSMTTRTAGNVVEGVGQVMHLIPDMTIGIAGMASTPVSVNQLPIGTKLAHAFAAAARILYTVSDITGTQAGLALTEGGWDRREADWIFQVAVIDIEIQQIERQILAAERRRDTALGQLNNLVQQKQHAAELHDFLRDKFTNHALYLFLQRELAALHHQMYDIAWCWARQAQRAFQLERDLCAQTFLQSDTWDGLHEGLLAGERLSTALRTMEKAYCDQNRREYELATRLSLRVDFPLAFLQLKVTGACEIEIPEWRLDREYPGHYLRRIKAVKLTIPAVVGPYTGVRCKLTLLSSAVRVLPTLLDVEDCCPGKCTCGCCDKRRYEAIGDDPRFVKRFGATEAIATSTGQSDAGLFELNFNDERYLPFEYAGAAFSRWRIELPIETNAFDIDSMSDLVFELFHHDKEGGAMLREASWAAASCFLPGAGLRFFDWRQDFPDAWHRFDAPLQADVREDCPRALNLRMRRSMFPYLPGQRPVRMRRVELWFEAQGCEDARNHLIEFVPDPDCACEDGNEECCERYFLTCTASEDWPCLFHGVLEYPFPYLREECQVTIGDFLFPHEVGKVYRAYLICSYEAGAPERCMPALPSCESGCKGIC